MFHVVLYQPEIPSNAGNLIRLCANTGSQLHLIEPLGFSLEDRQLRRAGLDYRDVVEVHVHNDFAACRTSAGESRLATFSTHHQRFFAQFRFQAGDMLLFGPETRGLPTELAQAAEESARLTIPMLPVGPDELPAGLAATAEGWIRTDPGMLAEAGGLDGFFIARWRRGA